MKYILLLGLLFAFGCSTAPVVEHHTSVLDDLTGNGCSVKVYSENTRRGDLRVECK